MSVEQLWSFSTLEHQQVVDNEISVDSLKEKYGVDVSGLTHGVIEDVCNCFLLQMNTLLNSLSPENCDSLNVFFTDLTWLLQYESENNKSKKYKNSSHLQFLPWWFSRFNFSFPLGDKWLMTYYDDFLDLQQKNKEKQVAQEEIRVQAFQKLSLNTEHIVVDEQIKLKEQQQEIATSLAGLRGDDEINAFFVWLDWDNNFQKFMKDSQPLFDGVPFTDTLSFERYMKLVYFLNQVKEWAMPIANNEVREQISGLDRLLVGVERRMGIVRPRLTYESIEYVEGADSGSLATIGQPEVFSMVHIARSGKNIFEHVEEKYQDEIFDDWREYLQSLWVEEVEMLDLYPPIIKVWVDGEIEQLNTEELVWLNKEQIKVLVLYQYQRQLSSLHKKILNDRERAYLKQWEEIVKMKSVDIVN